MELDQGKIINFVQDRIFHSNLKPFGKDNVSQKDVLYVSNLLVSVSIFGMDTTKNRWYRIGIVIDLKSRYRPSLNITKTAKHR